MITEVRRLWAKLHPETVGQTSRAASGNEIAVIISYSHSAGCSFRCILCDPAEESPTFRAESSLICFRNLVA
ncbi:unnamed protein product [Nippostrongylus brasiliensis]|uniref:Radical SAM protein n=1 Tax=Nippostrongylus brasiliensis TaxID=27835 RepID=A0A0N4YJK9_NIPBR|nr:unnamed protein product [Nippostrongylus brasiliensis]